MRLTVGAARPRDDGSVIVALMVHGVVRRDGANVVIATMRPRRIAFVDTIETKRRAAIGMSERKIVATMVRLARRRVPTVLRDRRLDQNQMTCRRATVHSGVLPTLCRAPPRPGEGFDFSLSGLPFSHPVPANHDRPANAESGTVFRRRFGGGQVSIQSVGSIVWSQSKLGFDREFARTMRGSSWDRFPALLRRSKEKSRE